MKNYQSISTYHFLRKLFFLSIILLSSGLMIGFTTSNNTSDIYDNKDIYDVKNMSYEELSDLKREVAGFLAQRKLTTNPTQLEVLNWEIFRRGYKHQLPKNIQKYIQQQVELKMIRGEKVEGKMEDELIKNPYNN